MRLPSRFLLASLLPTTLALGASTEAFAYSYESIGSVGCHERITSEALRRARASQPALAPIEPTDEEEALIRDLPFEIDADMQDVGAVTLLLGVRDNDLKGGGPTELDLALLHGDPDSQREHCLRHPDDDGPEGTQRAIAACRGFIREHFAAALSGLDASGAAPDPGARMPLEVTLAIRGQVEPPLPIYHVRMGQALHALQDAFTHAFRTPDGMRITTVLNWIEHVEGHLDEPTDGPAHRSELDRCTDDLPVLARNRALAEAASVELIEASVAPGLAPEQKLARADAVLSKYLSFEPGCSAENAWCEAPENELAVSRGCAAAPGRTNLTALALAALAAAALLSRRRKAARSRLPFFVALGLALQAGDAAAAPPEAASSKSSSDIPLSKQNDNPDDNLSQLGLYLASGASLDHAALAFSVGGRFRHTRRWVFGADVEWNPWIAVHTQDFRPGVLNAYGTVIRRFRLPNENVNLRTTANLGTSILLFDLFGAPQGSVGLYAGLTFLGLEFKASDHFYIIVDPLTMSLPIPQLSGAPFGYRQYRFTIGVEFASSPFG